MTAISAKPPTTDLSSLTVLSKTALSPLSALSILVVLLRGPLLGFPLQRRLHAQRVVLAVSSLFILWIMTTFPVYT
ncbi:hypothetical protein BC835DRAFT_543080 [Cytidiella melzeri]|nr:hypothetical protein BC835DRAFT_543080 [Cytidiella melzeri]